MALPLAACVRDPAEAVCPTINPGALVITEIRGPQTADDDVLGSWVEVYNASSSPIDLEGITLRFRRLDGSSEINTIVRRSLTLAPSDYATLGLFDDAVKPAHVDYGIAVDFHESFYTSAALEVVTCGERVDLVKYDSLPRSGTYSLGGAPTAENNDLPAMWCFDETMVASTYPGTPQAANIACP
jgi:hypothetical protein